MSDEELTEALELLEEALATLEAAAADDFEEDFVAWPTLRDIREFLWRHELRKAKA